MKNYYGESNCIKVPDYELECVSVLVEARPIYMDMHTKSKVFGRVYGENCYPLSDVQVIISCDAYSEYCTTDCEGRFETYLPFNCRYCEMRFLKEGYCIEYLPTHLVRCCEYEVVLKPCYC